MPEDHIVDLACVNPICAAEASFGEAIDQLMHQLFDAGLRLHRLRTIHDHTDATPPLGQTRDDLDTLIRETQLAVGAFASGRSSWDSDTRRW
ncbi:hypothetical protein IU500_36050 [Nocardia terpenica]|uniref:hypothetical protein n=1 Tax=Nocardia terpenica TaxID=455432 RepID=UPI00189375F7|nr:hypothetical protein [Nocardia terpenica]MBF6066380.1 hypothetical protein [Nocardia terpenica]MBF6109430.1 hypothetical protein [Nocardia terpenica]MBF6116627.1 hypothetical protein [Nocardia terpenica]MBF6123862.1 hypothetical protein [Nocardia terpenica]MBF6157208.1 hypothetical protein [Nocardia terpenica]